MKKLYVAVLFAFSALFAGSLAYAAPAAPNHTVLNVKLKEGVNVVTAGKTTYDITVKNNQVVNIAPVIPGGAMGGQHMSTKSVKFTTTKKNALCYYCWYDVYGRYWCVWRYCY